MSTRILTTHILLKADLSCVSSDEMNAMMFTATLLMGLLVYCIQTSNSSEKGMEFFTDSVAWEDASTLAFSNLKTLTFSTKKKKFNG